MKLPGIALLCSLLLQGCLSTDQTRPAPAKAPVGPTAEALFLQGLGELDQTPPSPAFDELRRSFPESAWARQVDVQTEASKSRRQLDRDVRRLRKELANAKKQLEQADAEIRRLKGDLQQMKEVLIETELRSK